MRKRKEFGNKNTIGERVIALRTARKLKQKDLMAQLQVKGIDIAPSTLSDLEGQKKIVTAEELIALAEIFDMTAEELFYGKTDF